MTTTTITDTNLIANTINDVIVAIDTPTCRISRHDDNPFTFLVVNRDTNIAFEYTLDDLVIAFGSETAFYAEHIVTIDRARST